MLQTVVVVGSLSWVASVAAASGVRCEKLLRSCDGSSLAEVARQAEASCGCSLGPAELGQCIDNVTAAYEPRLPRRCRRLVATTLTWSACAGGSDVLCEVPGKSGARRISLTTQGACLGAPLPGVTNAVSACAPGGGSPTVPGDPDPGHPTDPGEQPGRPPRPPQTPGGARINATTYVNALVLGNPAPTPGPKIHATASLTWLHRPGQGQSVQTAVNITEIADREPFQLPLEHRNVSLQLDDLQLPPADQPPTEMTPPSGGMIVCELNLGAAPGEVDAVAQRWDQFGTDFGSALARETAGPVSLAGLPQVMGGLVTRVSGGLPAGHPLGLGEAAARILGIGYPHGCAAVTVVAVPQQSQLDSVGLRCDGNEPVCAPAAATRLALRLHGGEGVPWIADIRTTVHDARLSVETMQVHRIVVETVTCSDPVAGTDSLATLSIAGQDLFVDRPGVDRRPGWTERTEVPIAKSIRGADPMEIALDLRIRRRPS